MRYRSLMSIALVWILAFTVIVLPVHAQEDNQTGQSGPEQSAGCSGLDAVSSYLGSVKISDNMGAAVLFEPKSETMMFSLNPDAKVYPSSLVKILTALIAVEKGNPAEMITVRQAVLDTVYYGAASADLVADEQMSLSDLIYCMMVGSANDAAAVIADHIAGSQTAFVEMMNKYAADLGCTGTQFRNVHGLHDEEQYTTARDMARILHTAVKNEEFLKYFSAIKYTVPATNKTLEPRELASQNFLMNTEKMEIYFDERAIGGRTGITETGLRCLATLAENDGMQLISIVMDAKSTEDDRGNTSVYGSFNETKLLLDAGFNGYTVVQTLYKDQVLKQMPVKNGSNDVLVGSTGSAYSVLPSGTKMSDLSYRFMNEPQNLEAPIQAGERISYVQVWHGNLCVGQAELVAVNTVYEQLSAESPSELVASQGNDNHTTLIIVLIVIGAIVLASGLRYGRPIYMRMRKERLQKQRQNRRRTRNG